MLPSEIAPPPEAATAPDTVLAALNAAVPPVTVIPPVMELALLSVATPPLTVIVIDPVFVRLVPDRSVYVLPAEMMPPTVRTLFSPDIVTAPPAPIVIVPELATLFESVLTS